MSVLDAPGRLKADAAALLDAGKAASREYKGLRGSFFNLLASDLSLASAALLQGGLLLFVALLTLGTAWLVGMAMVVAGLHDSAGLSWQMALAATLLLNLLVAIITGLMARQALAFADLGATRRQISAWFARERAEQAEKSQRAAAEAEASATGAVPGATGPGA